MVWGPQRAANLLSSLESASDGFLFGAALVHSNVIVQDMDDVCHLGSCWGTNDLEDTGNPCSVIKERKERKVNVYGSKLEKYFKLDEIDFCSDDFLF
jgi:hypothetical protein